jgi:hypothetical protein
LLSCRFVSWRRGCSRVTRAPNPALSGYEAPETGQVLQKSMGLDLVGWTLFRDRAKRIHHPAIRNALIHRQRNHLEKES